MKSDIYPYASGDLLSERNTYFYSSYHGALFLNAWASQRTAALQAGATRRNLHEDATPTLAVIRRTQAGLADDSNSTLALRDMDRLVQRFEVTKRVHDAYDEGWRAVDPKKFHAVNVYVELSEAFATAYQQTGALTYLNVLLKILDTLTSISGSLSDSLRRRLSALIEQEAAFIADLRAAVAGRRPPSAPALTDIKVVGADLPKTILLACDSARSRTYIQSMCRFGVAPSEVYLMGSESVGGSLASEDGVPGRGIFSVDLAEPISTTCARAGIALMHVPERDVNSEGTIRALGAMNADVVVYSGIGGQIVSKRALMSGPRFLHLHSGWLPDYRGSTTLYYAILNGELPGVSAILLDPGIDTGPVALRQKYPLPDAGMDVDQLYDAAIRADALCRTLASFSQKGSVEAEISQSADDGRTYFVIHPVLKHVALLSLGNM